MNLSLLIMLQFGNTGEGPGGGLGIILRKGLQHDSFQLTPFQNGKLEVQAVKIILKNNDNVILVNIYNPNESVTIQEMKTYLRQLGRKYVLVGDFNAHMPLLDSCCRNSNFTGKTLETITLEERICLINHVDCYTYICPTTGTLEEDLTLTCALQYQTLQLILISSWVQMWVVTTVAYCGD